MPTYKTPNVYVEEISTFPPSVAEVSTAIPAFIGYTEKAQVGNEDLTFKPTRISTLLEYESLFGGAKATNFEITVSEDKIQSISTPPLKYLIYYALRLYFDNGGGSCYIISIGNYQKEAAKDDFGKALDALKKEDEPTLILPTDAVNLSENDYYEFCKKALQQCNNLGDRFAIFDVLPKKGDGKEPNGGFAKFRDGIGSNYLKYGAAYLPYLQTSLNYYYTDDSVTVKGVELTTTSSGTSTPPQETTSGETSAPPQETTSSGTSTPPQGTTSSGTSVKLGDDKIKTQKTALYHSIKTELDKRKVVLPPSAAVAGAYATVDRERGVWKAPANVSLFSVIGPVEKITNEEQEELNVDPTAGKSINAIRSFTGKGTLIWGARTLAGNDNEWRYIPVRRLFNLIQESTQKATAFAVFESNNAITWLKVKSMIDSYLESLWRQGALAGATAEQAYFVSVGLGKTMTPQDILEGRMIIEIGIAAVRPAEFIILRFSHKLQEA